MSTMHDRLESAPPLVSIYIFIFHRNWGGDSSPQERKNRVLERLPALCVHNLGNLWCYLNFRLDVCLPCNHTNLQVQNGVHASICKI